MPDRPAKGLRRFAFAFAHATAAYLGTVALATAALVCVGIAAAPPVGRSPDIEQVVLELEAEETVGLGRAASRVRRGTAKRTRRRMALANCDDSEPVAYARPWSSQISRTRGAISG
jgi:hypothetical protein